MKIGTHFIHILFTFDVDKNPTLGIVLPAYLPSLWCKPSSNVAGFLFPQTEGERP